MKHLTENFILWYISRLLTPFILLILGKVMNSLSLWHGKIVCSCEWQNNSAALQVNSISPLLLHMNQTRQRFMWNQYSNASFPDVSAINHQTFLSVQFFGMEFSIFSCKVVAHQCMIAKMKCSPNISFLVVLNHLDMCNISMHINNMQANRKGSWTNNVREDLL